MVNLGWRVVVVVIEVVVVVVEVDEMWNLKVSIGAEVLADP